MDGDVSWQQAMSVIKMRYPGADQLTLIHFARELYLASHSMNGTNSFSRAEKHIEKKKRKHRFTLQGAWI